MPVSIERATRWWLRILRTLRCSGRWAATIRRRQADPHGGHLGTAVGIQGHRVSQRRGVEHRSGAAGQRVVMEVHASSAGHEGTPGGVQARCGKAIEEPERPVLPPSRIEFGLLVSAGCRLRRADWGSYWVAANRALP